MTARYDFRTNDASACTTFLVPLNRPSCYRASVDSADAILAALKARGIKHEAIAEALGVATTNATKLYNPATKTGKTRRLAYDEGVMLIKAFGLSERSEEAEALPLSLPVARLVVQYVAARLGIPAGKNDPLVEDTALDVQAFSAFASQRPLRESESQVEGFFQGLRAQGRQSGRG